MTLTAILVLVVLLSYLSVRSEFILLKITAMASWFVLFIYFQGNPPTPFTEGTAGHQLLLVVCVAAGIGIALMSFGRNVNRNRTSNGVSTSDFKWKFGKDKDEVEGRSAGHKETIEEYQARVRRALRRD